MPSVFPTLIIVTLTNNPMTCVVCKIPAVSSHGDTVDFTQSRISDTHTILRSHQLPNASITSSGHCLVPMSQL